MKMQGACAWQGKPVFNLDFLSGAMDSRMTYTGGNGSFFNSSGLVTAATTNVARLDYNPTTLAVKGYLNEIARINALKSSGAIGDANWTNTLVTATLNNATGPDGTTSATLITNTSVTLPLTQQAIGTNATGNYAISCFVKQGTANGVIIYLSDGVANSVGSLFTFSGSSFTNATVGSVSVVGTPAAQILPNSWFRITIVVNFASVSAGLVLNIGAWNDTLGNATNGATVLVYGAQSENAQVSCSSYIPTAGATVTRTIDRLSNSSISGFFNGTHGSFVLTGIPELLNTAAIMYPASFSDNSTLNFIAMNAAATTGVADGNIFIGGGGQASAGTAGSIVAGSTFKMGLSYTTGANLFTFNGTADGAGTFAAGTVPGGITRLDVGNRSDGVRPFIGWIQRFQYWNYKLSAAQLVTVTT